VWIANQPKQNSKECPCDVEASEKNQARPPPLGIDEPSENANKSSSSRSGNSAVTDVWFSRFGDQSPKVFTFSKQQERDTDDDWNLSRKCSSVNLSFIYIRDMESCLGVIAMDRKVGFLLLIHPCFSLSIGSIDSILIVGDSITIHSNNFFLMYHNNFFL
jgi:hypothetical protein